MNSKDWKLLVLVPIAISFLAACQNGSNSDDSSSPTSPYAGLWVNETSVNALNGCENAQAAYSAQDVVLDAVLIHNDGQVYRYAVGNNPRAQENLCMGSIGAGSLFTPKLSTPATAGYGFNNGPSSVGDPRLAINYGVFGKIDDDHIYVTDSYGAPQKRFQRSSEAELKAHYAAILACLGRYNIQNSREPDGPPPTHGQQQQPQYSQPTRMQPLPPPGQGQFPQQGRQAFSGPPPQVQGFPAQTPQPQPSDMQESYPPGYR